MQAGCVDADNCAIGGVAIEKAIGEDAFAKLAVVAIKASTAKDSRGGKGRGISLFGTCAVFDIGDHFFHREERDTVHVFGEPEDAIGIDENNHTIDALIDVIKLLHPLDELVRCSNGAFECFMYTVIFVLVEIIAITTDFALPVFDLDDKGDVFMYDHKVLFQIERFMRHDDVADDAFKMLAKCAVNSFLTLGAKGFNFFDGWEAFGAGTV